jgi:hypothetical protein
MAFSAIDPVGRYDVTVAVNVCDAVPSSWIKAAVFWRNMGLGTPSMIMTAVARSMAELASKCSVGSTLRCLDSGRQHADHCLRRRPAHRGGIVRQGPRSVPQPGPV